MIWLTIIKLCNRIWIEYHWIIQMSYNSKLKVFLPSGNHVYQSKQKDFYGKCSGCLKILIALSQENWFFFFRRKSHVPSFQINLYFPEMCTDFEWQVKLKIISAGNSNIKTSWINETVCGSHLYKSHDLSLSSRKIHFPQWVEINHEGVFLLLCQGIITRYVFRLFQFLSSHEMSWKFRYMHLELSCRNDFNFQPLVPCFACRNLSMSWLHPSDLTREVSHWN